MPRFAANLSFLYPELPFMQRFEAAAKDGFTAVEFLFPYSYEASDVAAQLAANGLQQVLFNAPPGGGADPRAIDEAWVKGMRGTAALPGREAEFRAGFELALRYADALACPRIHVLAGVVASVGDHAAYRETYVANLRWACGEAARAGRDVLIEPLNPRDVPGYLITHQAEAHAVLAEVGEPNLKVQMDLYHAQIVEGDLASLLRQYLPAHGQQGPVGHIQVAGVPERHEPDVGEVNYPYLFKLMDELGYDGWVGCEYRPARGAVPGGTTAGLRWLA